MSVNQRIRAFVVAFRGIKLLITNEPHAKFHLFASIAVTGAGSWCGLTGTEWAVLCGCIGIVWMAEAFNTALERLADRVTTDQDPLIRDAKDLAAGGVLLVSFGAAAAGLCILLPAILTKIGQ